MAFPGAGEEMLIPHWLIDSWKEIFFGIFRIGFSCLGLLSVTLLVYFLLIKCIILVYT